MSKVNDLPSLDGFTRGELEELIGILHGALTVASVQFEELHDTAQASLDLARRAAGKVAA